MCSSHHNHDIQSTGTPQSDDALALRVEDMTCGHCAGTIKKAIESSLPGTRVHADVEARSVSVTGTSDLARLREIVASAGYTAAAEPARA
jgi:copper chaperone